MIRLFAACQNRMSIRESEPNQHGNTYFYVLRGDSDTVVDRMRLTEEELRDLHDLLQEVFS